MKTTQLHQGWSFRNATSEPHPSLQAEIWVGGSSERAIRRALELGDVWHPSRGSDAKHVRRVKEQHPELRIIPRTSLALITVPEPTQLLIKPFDATTLKAIEKAIQSSDLGLNPNNDGKVIHLNLPPLTEERRRELVKHVHHRLEEARIAVRNIRRDSHNDMRDFEKEKLISEDDLKRGEEDLQKMTDRFVEEISKHGQTKEKEIMEV